ncbi:MAG: hypothetical protein ACFFCM_21795 [Promethearchaeota archaeon]
MNRGRPKLKEDEKKQPITFRTQISKGFLTEKAKDMNFKNITDLIRGALKAYIYEDEEKVSELPKNEDVITGFKMLYNFFVWVSNNHKKLLKDPKLYLSHLQETVDIKLLDKLEEKFGLGGE